MADCNQIVGPNFAQNQPALINTNDGCSELATGQQCPTVNSRGPCSPYQLNKNRDSCLIDSVVNEALVIGGATINVRKLLGVHEQSKLVDCTGKGTTLSGGDAPGFVAMNAFDTFITEWKSIQRGPDTLTSSYIGYDFGEIKTAADHIKYSAEASVRKHITAIAIKQSDQSANRATRIRLERSDDGIRWYGVGIADLPDDGCLNTVLLKQSVPSRYWRIRPLVFNGDINSSWNIQALEFYHDYVATDIDNIQDKVLFENRDRDYSNESFEIKVSYDLVDVSSELTRFGIELPSQSLYMQVSFSACVNILNRPFVVGDIMEIPSEAQYSADLTRIEKWMEVVDVAWSTEGYTPGWQPTLLRLVVQPAYATQETQDIFGDLADTLMDDLGLVGNEASSKIQDYSDISDTILAQAKEDVPQRGLTGSSTIREFEDDEIQQVLDNGGIDITKLGLNSTGLYVEDAMPSNNHPFTEGPEYATNPKHGDYHRLTYEGLAKGVPTRLYRYSAEKQSWIYLETDRRSLKNSVQPILQEYITSPNAVHVTDITKED